MLLFGIVAPYFPVHESTSVPQLASYVTAYTFLSYSTSTIVLPFHLIICCVISLAVNHATVFAVASVLVSVVHLNISLKPSFSV